MTEYEYRRAMIQRRNATDREAAEQRGMTLAEYRAFQLRKAGQSNRLNRQNRY